jgi:hypothetical protein
LAICPSRVGVLKRWALIGLRDAGALVCWWGGRLSEHVMLALGALRAGGFCDLVLGRGGGLVFFGAG